MILPLARAALLLALLAPAARGEEPAASPPAPTDLSAPPRPAAAPEVPALDLPASVETVPGLGWRLAAPGGAEARRGLETVGRHLAEQTAGRVTVLSEVAGPEDDPSTARRESLARAWAARDALERGGLPGTRVDLLPLGRTEAGRDLLLVRPPAPRGGAS